MAWWMWTALGLVLYLQTGYWMGRLSLRIWREALEKRKLRGTLPLLLFPISTVKDKTFDKRGSKSLGFFIEEAMDGAGQERYCRTTALIWPFRTVWNACILSGLAVYGACLVAVVAMTSGPGMLAAKTASLLAARRERRAAARVRIAAPAEDDKFAFRAEMIAHLKGERVRIDRELFELEAAQELESGPPFRGAQHLRRKVLQAG